MIVAGEKGKKDGSNEERRERRKEGAGEIR